MKLEVSKNRMDFFRIKSFNGKLPKPINLGQMYVLFKPKTFFFVISTKNIGIFDMDGGGKGEC